MTTLRKRDKTKTDKILKRYRDGSVDLIGILQAIQEEYGYVPRPIVEYISKELNIYPSRIFGILTFYAQFSLEPKGKNIIKVCRGTACHVKGSLKISKKIQSFLNIDGEGTTKDNLFTLEHLACFGACARAPIVVINNDVYGEMSPDRVDSLVKRY